MAKFGLELHSEKTRLIEFRSLRQSNRHDKGLGKPETFDFLGFTHICGQTRKGHFQLVRHTARKKFQAKVAAIEQQLRRDIHRDIQETGQWLKSVYDGWCRYYAVPGNYACLRSFQDALQTHWLRLLRRVVNGVGNSLGPSSHLSATMATQPTYPPSLSRPAPSQTVSRQTS